MWLSEEGIAIATNRTLRKLGVEHNPAKTIFSAELVDMNGEKGYQEANTAVRLEAGKTYVATTDSGTFVEKCVENGGVWLIGNPAIGGGEDNGKSFAVMVIDGKENGWFLMAIDAAGGNHITVTEAETTTPIDPKYLRKEIKLESYADGNGGNLAGYILDLFARGGGTTTITFIDNLWADLKANKEIRVTMPVQASVERAYTIATDSITRLWWTDNCIQLSINMMFMLDDGQLYNIFVTILYQTNGNHLLIVRAA